MCLRVLLLPLCVHQRTDDEAVVDRGGTRCQQGTNFEKADLEGTRTDTECIWKTKSYEQKKAAAAEDAYSVLTTAAFLLTAFFIDKR